MTATEREQQIGVAANVVWGARMYLVTALQQSRAAYPELEPGVEAIVVESRCLEVWLNLLDKATADLLHAANAPAPDVLSPVPPRRPPRGRPQLRVVE